MKLIIFQFADKQCQTVAQQVSQFNGCSVPDWMPNDLVNTPGDSMMDSLSNYFWNEKDPKLSENYAKIFESDCNKHDICYGCVRNYSNVFPPNLLLHTNMK